MGFFFILHDAFDLLYWMLQNFFKLSKRKEERENFCSKHSFAKSKINLGLLAYFATYIKF